MADNARRFLPAFAAALLLAGCSVSATGENVGGESEIGQSAACQPGEPRGEAESGLDQISLCITSNDRVHSFTVEVARSPQEQSRGLMFREKLPDDRGMLFPYDSPQPLSFWMKNTVIPLDIIFIAPGGRIESIAAQTTPYSLDSVSSHGAAIAVLEIRGGLAAEIGIKPGDIIKWRK